MNNTKIVLLVLLFLVLSIPACLFIKGCNTAEKFIDNGLKTTYEQFKPEELLRKYEWFKDASSQLDQKIATLKTYETRFGNIKMSYGNDSTNRRVWDRSDKEQWNIWQSEYLGIKASYNDLCAQYNSSMVKFNYRFCNIGDLPQGASMPLPREFKPYITN